MAEYFTQICRALIEDAHAAHQGVDRVNVTSGIDRQTGRPRHPAFAIVCVKLDSVAEREEVRIRAALEHLDAEVVLIRDDDMIIEGIDGNRARILELAVGAAAPADVQRQYVG